MYNFREYRPSFVDGDELQNFKFASAIELFSHPLIEKFEKYPLFRRFSQQKGNIETMVLAELTDSSFYVIGFVTPATDLDLAKFKG